MYSLNPEDDSIAETLVKTLLNSIDCRIFKLTQFVCSAVEGSFFFKSLRQRFLVVIGVFTKL